MVGVETLWSGTNGLEAGIDGKENCVVYLVRLAWRCSPSEGKNRKQALNTIETGEELCFISTMPDDIYRFWFARNFKSLVEMFLCIHLNVRIWHQEITICFCLCRLIWLQNNSSQQKSVQIGWPSCLPEGHSDLTFKLEKVVD